MAEEHYNNKPGIGDSNAPDNIVSHPGCSGLDSCEPGIGCACAKKVMDSYDVKNGDVDNE